MKIDRLFKIVYILLEKKTITAKELAEDLEVSVRTIYRDIDSLSAAGMPVYTTSGIGGGIGILDNFVLNKSAITEEEQNYILMALENLSAVDNMNLDATLKKFKTIFEKSNTTWIEVDYSRWGNDDEDKIKFNILRDAILNKKIIAFMYYNSYGTHSKRTVEPIKLVFKTRAWYLQCYCLDKSAYRTFKINRIDKLHEKNEKFTTIHNNLPSIENFENSAKDLQVIKLKFDPKVSYRIYDEFKSKDIEIDDDKSLIATMKVHVQDWLYSYILSFGTYVEVLEPKNLRDEIRSQVEIIYKKYLS